jgi:predicted nuclease with TOPRIM domain
VKALLEKNSDPAPLLAAFTELRNGVRERESQIEELQATCRRLEVERHRLHGIIEQMRAAAGNNEPRPF